MAAKSKHPLYSTYTGMLARCNNPNTSHYKHYGGRGIKVCQRWQDDFWAFVKDVGGKPGPKYSLDRIDNDGPYSPDNCRWATARQQNANRRKPTARKRGGYGWTVSEIIPYDTGGAETSLRMALARRQMTRSDLIKVTGLNNQTVTKFYDEIPDGIIVGSLRQVAAALGLGLVIQFEEPLDNGHA